MCFTYFLAWYNNVYTYILYFSCQASSTQYTFCAIHQWFEGIYVFSEKFLSLSNTLLCEHSTVYPSACRWTCGQCKGFIWGSRCCTSGLRIQHGHSCSPELTLGLGTSICLGCGQKKKKCFFVGLAPTDVLGHRLWWVKVCVCWGTSGSGIAGSWCVYIPPLIYRQLTKAVGPVRVSTKNVWVFRLQDTLRHFRV